MKVESSTIDNASALLGSSPVVSPTDELYGGASNLMSTIESINNEARQAKRPSLVGQGLSDARVAANRRSAQKCRRRKKQIFEELQKSLVRLSKENRFLRERNEILEADLKGIQARCGAGSAPNKLAGAFNSVPGSHSSSAPLPISNGVEGMNALTGQQQLILAQLLPQHSLSQQQKQQNVHNQYQRKIQQQQAPIQMQLMPPQNHLQTQLQVQQPIQTQLIPLQNSTTMQTQLAQVQQPVQTQPMLIVPCSMGSDNFAYLPNKQIG